MNPRRWTLRLGVLAAVLAVTMSCAEPQTTVDRGAAPAPQVSTVAPGPTVPSSRPPAAKPAKPAPVPASLRFSATTVDGKAFDGASLQGKPVLLWFWAPWCPTCRSQIPQVQRLTKQYDGQVSVVGVGSLDNAAAIKAFAEQIPEVTTHLSDERGTVYKHFRIVEQSSFVLLDSRGDETFRTRYGGSNALADEVAAVAN